MNELKFYFPADDKTTMKDQPTATTKTESTEDGITTSSGNEILWIYSTAMQIKTSWLIITTKAFDFCF